MGFSISGIAANLDDDPFFWVRLGPDEVDRLLSQLTECAGFDRVWFSLAATYENPSRLRLKRDTTPEYEETAAPLYLRGDRFRVSGKSGRSCNITFSSLGAADLAERLGQARTRMSAFVELRIPSRHHDLVEFIPDTDLHEPASGTDDALMRSSEIAGAQALPAEDFSDWE